jgi:hypothetical protein
LKKLLVSALTAAMVLGFGATAFAVSTPVTIAPPAFSDIAGHKAEAELTAFAALGIFTGSSGIGGAVKPDDAITRAEFSKVIVLATGRGSTAAGLAGLRPTFTDEIPAWAWGFVNVASYMGVIGGYPDGTFKASNPITYAEAVTMLVRAVSGHKAQVGAGIWPYNFLFYAVDNGFTGPVDVGFASLPCTRGDMARLLFATMQVDPLDATGAADEDGALLEEGANLFTGVLEYIAPTWLGLDYGGGGYDIDLADPVYLTGAKTFADLHYTSLIAVSKNGKAVSVHRTEGRTISGLFSKADSDGAGNEFLLLADGTKVPFTGAVNVILNGEDENNQNDLLAGDELVINLDAAGKAVSATAFRWDYIVGDLVGEVYEHEDVIMGGIVKSTPDTPQTRFQLGEGEFHRNGCSCHFNYSNITVPASVPVTINGKTAKADDLAQYDVVRIATYGAHGGHGPAVIKMAATRNTLKGVVTGTSTTYPGPVLTVNLKVDGVTKTYTIGAPYCGLPSPNQLRQYALNAAGELFYPVDFTSVNPVVYVTGASSETTGGDTRYFLSVDQRGVAQTFEYDYGLMGDLSGGVGSFLLLTIDGGTGIVTGASTLFGSSDIWEVVAVNAGGATLLHEGTYLFVAAADTVVYKTDADGTAYLGLEGLVVGDTVITTTNYEVLVHVTTG